MRIIIGVIVAIWLTGCINDAPHDNPLDPINGLEIQGKVERLYTADPIPGAKVTLLSNNVVSISNQEGNFRLKGDFSPGNYSVTCEIEGFRAETLSVSLPQETPLTFKLDALPVFTNMKLTTHHIARFFPPDDLFFIQLEVTVNDSDGLGDIQQVTYHIPSLNFSDTLTQVSPPQPIFAGELEPHHAGLLTLHEFIGHPFFFTVSDIPGAISRSQGQYLTRIIEEIPTGVSPTGGETVSPPFTIEWQPDILPYSFTYAIGIYQQFFNFSVLIEEVTEIPSDSTSITYSTPLAPGNYYWVVYIEDEFGNRSRSRENPFTIP